MVMGKVAVNGLLDESNLSKTVVGIMLIFNKHNGQLKEVSRSYKNFLKCYCH